MDLLDQCDKPLKSMNWRTRVYTEGPTKLHLNAVIRLRAAHRGGGRGLSRKLLKV